MTPVQIFEDFCNQSSAVSSSKKKLEIAKQFAQQGCPYLADLLRYSVDPTCQFFASLPELELPESPDLSMEDLGGYLFQLRSRDLSVDEVRSKAEELRLGKWTRRLINKSLRIGVGSVIIEDAFGIQIPREPFTAPEKIQLEDPKDYSSLFFNLKSPCYLIPMPDGVNVMIRKEGNKLFPFSHWGFPVRNIDTIEASVLELFQGVPSVQIFGKLVSGSTQKAVEAFSQVRHDSEPTLGHLTIAYVKLPTGEFADIHPGGTDQIQIHRSCVIPPRIKADFTVPLTSICPGCYETWIYEEPMGRFYRITA